VSSHTLYLWIPIQSFLNNHQLSRANTTTLGAHGKPRVISPRGDRDLNGAPSATHEPLDLTGRHVEPDHRDIDGRRRSTSHDAPDLTGPHQEHDNVDINGHYPSNHPAPDLISRTASPGARR
jgi:hypothetical protein